MEEQKLIRAARKGSDAAFEALIEKHRAKIYGICLRFLCNEQDAQDAAQEAMIKIYLSIGKYNSKASFSTWVYALTRNTALDHLRSKRKNTELSYDELAELGGSIFVCGDETAQSAVKKEDKKEIAQLVNSLPKNQRICVILKDIDGYSCEDIAEILKQPVGTVKSRLHRGRARLQELLRENGFV